MLKQMDSNIRVQESTTTTNSTIGGLTKRLIIQESETIATTNQKLEENTFQRELEECLKKVENDRIKEE